MLHFVHVRKRKTTFVPQAIALNLEFPVFKQASTVEVKGGNTVAYAFDDKEKRLMYATARCSKKDNYCKRAGRELTAKRLIPSSTRPFTNIVAYANLPNGKPTYKNISAYFYNLLKDS